MVNLVSKVIPVQSDLKAVLEILVKPGSKGSLVLQEFRDLLDKREAMETLDCLVQLVTLEHLEPRAQ